MPRNGAGVYSLPAGSTVTNGETSDQTDINTPLSDIETDMNTARSIVSGGTGATTEAGARSNLDLLAKSENGTVSGNRVFSGTSTFTGDIDLTGANVSGIFGGAPLYTWSGQTFVDFTNIPAWPSQILLNFRNFSMSAASAAIAVRVGDEDGLKVTDYSGDFGRLDESESYTHNPATTNFAVGFLSPAQTNGTLLLNRTAPQENSWTVIAVLGNPGSDRQFITTGSVFLPKPLTQIRVFPSSGTGDSGTLGVSWRL